MLRYMMDAMSTASAPGVKLLPPHTGSLARGLPQCRPGTLFALGDRGGISVQPGTKLDVLFGRNEPEVHVCVGAGDRGVSRQHGLLRHDGRHWTVTNTGRVPIRMPGSHLLLSGHEEPLAVAYTPLFIRSGRDREHLLEVRVAGKQESSSATADEDTLMQPTWDLNERERLVLVALGQRYLRHEAFPQPLSWTLVAEDLAALHPEENWTAKRAEHVVSAVRRRLVEHAVRGLTRDEVGEPVGNALNHNLLVELLQSTTLVPPDLRLLDGA